MQISGNEPSFREDIQQILQNHDENEWVNLVKKEDKTREAAGDVIASFFESLVNSNAVTNNQLLIKTIELLQKKDSKKGLSQKAHDTFHQALGLYEQIKQHVPGLAQEQVTSFKIPLTILDMNLDMLTSIGKYIEPKDLVNFLSSNKKIWEQRGSIVGSNEPFLNFLFLKLAGKLDTLPKELEEGIKANSSAVRSLDLKTEYGESSITGEDLAKIVELCPNLEHLDLTRDPYYSRTTTSFSGNALEPVGKLTKLTKVGLGNHTYLTEAELQYLPQSIQTLSLQEVHINDESLKKVLNRLPNLIELNLARCSNIVGSALQVLPSTLLRLHLVDTKINDDNLEQVVKKCQNLLELNLEGCKELRSIRALPQRVLKLNIENCTRLIEKDFQKAIKECHHLLNLNIGGTFLRGDYLGALSPTLQTLTLGRNIDITEQNLHTLFINCKNLIEFTIYVNNQLDGSSLQEITPNIRKLTLRSCQGLTDENLKIAFEKWPELVFLDLSYCAQLDGSSLPALKDKLQELHITDCTGIPSEIKEEIKARGVKVKD